MADTEGGSPAGEGWPDKYLPPETLNSELFLNDTPNFQKLTIIPLKFIIISRERETEC